MKRATLMMITVFLVGYSTARYLLVEVIDGVDGRGIEGNSSSLIIKNCNNTFFYYGNVMYVSSMTNIMYFQTFVIYQ